MIGKSQFSLASKCLKEVEAVGAGGRTDLQGLLKMPPGLAGKEILEVGVCGDRGFWWER